MKWSITSLSGFFVWNPASVQGASAKTCLKSMTVRRHGSRGFYSDFSHHLRPPPLPIYVLDTILRISLHTQFYKLENNAQSQWGTWPREQDSRFSGNCLGLTKGLLSLPVVFIGRKLWTGPNTSKWNSGDWQQLMSLKARKAPCVPCQPSLPMRGQWRQGRRNGDRTGRQREKVI